MMGRLRELQRTHPDVVGDVRGLGLMVGMDIVRGGGGGKAHAPATARWIKERCKVRARRRAALSAVPAAQKHAGLACSWGRRCAVSHASLGTCLR